MRAPAAVPMAIEQTGTPSALSWVLENGLRLPTSDSQCGLKCFDKKGKEVFLSTQIDRFLFDLEFLVLASKKADLSISTVAVELREGVKFSRVGWQILLTEAINFLKILIAQAIKQKPDVYENIGFLKKKIAVKN